MPDHLRRVRPTSRRGRWLAVAAGVATVLGLIAAQSASAGSTATVDGGTLTPGVQATATFAAAGDVETFSILVPTSQRLTLTVADSTAPVQVGVTGFTPDGGGSGHTVVAKAPTIGNTSGAVRFEEFSDYPLDQHVTITMTSQGAGQLPFTPALVADAAAVPIALDTPTPVTIGTPAQRVSFSLAPSSVMLGVRVSAVALTPSGGRDGFTGQPYSLSTSPSSARRTDTDGVYTIPAPVVDPEDPPQPQPVKITLGGVDGATGTLTLEVFAIGNVTHELTRGTPYTVELTSPLSSAKLTWTAVPARRDLIQVTSVNLKHPDGTAGSVTLSHGSGSSGNTDRIGTVSDKPFTWEDANPDLRGGASPRELDIATDGRTTGTLTVLVTTAPEPPTITLAVGRPTPITLRTPNQSQYLTLPVTAGHGYVFTVSHAAMRSASGGTPDATYLSLQPPGSSNWLGGYYARSAMLEPGVAGLVFSYQAEATGDLTVLVNPLSDMVGHLTLTVRPLQDVARRIAVGPAVTAATTAPLQRIVLTAPPAGGAQLPAVHLTGITLTPNPGANPYGATPSATVTVEQDGKALKTFDPKVWDTTTAVDYPAAAVEGLDPAKPWQLVVTPSQDVLVRVTARLQQTSTVG